MDALWLRSGVASDTPQLLVHPDPCYPPWACPTAFSPTYLSRQTPRAVRAYGSELVSRVRGPSGPPQLCQSGCHPVIRTTAFEHLPRAQDRVCYATSPLPSHRPQPARLRFCYHEGPITRADAKVGLHVSTSGPVKSPIPPPSSPIRKLTVYDRPRWKLLLLHPSYNHSLRLLLARPL